MFLRSLQKDFLKAETARRRSRSRTPSAAGRSLLSLAVPERTRSTQGIDLRLPASEQNRQFIPLLRNGNRRARCAEKRLDLRDKSQQISNLWPNEGGMQNLHIPPPKKHNLQPKTLHTFYFAGISLSPANSVSAKRRALAEELCM
jgi:hypothetical protein